MLEYIKGEITELTPASVVVDCNGLGYLMNISLNTFTTLQGKDRCKLYVYEAIREDAYILFGFTTKQERELFLQLITVSGVGANTARMILSSLGVQEVEQAIVDGNASLLKSVKGIGLKTAQRIIVDLKDKMKSAMPSSASMLLSNQEVREEAISALVTLGFSQSASQKAIDTILHDNPESTVQQIIKAALRIL